MSFHNDKALLRWELHGHGEAPGQVAAAAAARAREDQLARFREFAEPYRREDGTAGNVTDLVPQLIELNRQMELKFPSMTKRSLVRLHLADAIERKVLPLTDDDWLHSLPERLRNARKDFCLGFRPSDGKKRVMWDEKAGLSRICPDDAREDAMRMQRRVIEPLMELKKNGRNITYSVFTLPNYQPGELRRGIKDIYRKFGALLRKRKGGKLKYDNIEAAMCVLEAPLARDRTWNVHLNVLLVHRGFLDYGELRKDWHWNVQFSRVRGGRQELEQSLREIIKYSARAVVEKSECENGSSPLRGDPARAPVDSLAGASALIPHAPEAWSGSETSTCNSTHEPGPPAMVDWTGQELLEWLTAFRGFRRTRTYRALYRLEKPAKDDLAGYLWVGRGQWVRAGWRLTIGPLDSIPGDKSTTPDALERWKKLMGWRGPPPRPPDKCERFA